MFEPKLFDRQAPEFIRQLRRMGKQVYLSLPHVTRDGELSYVEPCLKQLIQEGLSGFLVRNLESFCMLKMHGLQSYAVLDQNLYTMNQQAQRFWGEQGAAKDTASLELNEKELRQRHNHRSEMIIYGYTPMMISAQCLKKNLDSCTKQHEVLTVKDRYNKKFTVQCCCNSCYNIIYNSVPSVLLKEAMTVKALGMNSLRLAFTIEDYQTTKETAQAYISRYVYDRPVDFEGDYTRGHFRRGIE